MPPVKPLLPAALEALMCVVALHAFGHFMLIMLLMQHSHGYTPLLFAVPLAVRLLCLAQQSGFAG